MTEIPGLTHDQRDALRTRALELRHDPVFPKGVNVNLYCRLAEDKVRILTFERGVEDYTLACGTGSGSVAVVLWLKGELPHGRVAVENPGGTLTVTISGNDGIVEELFLEGPAEVLNTYEL